MTKEEFIEWKEHPVTKYVFNIIKENRVMYADSLVSGASLGEELRTARMVGVVEGLDSLLNIQFEEDE